jgi:hypothetical protein
MSRPLPLLVAIGVIVCAGVVHGVWTSRWQTSEKLAEAVARVPLVPGTVGDWHSKDVEVNPEGYAQTGALGYWMRRYKHQKTNREVTVILMCGPSGKMSVHTPNICYQGAGFVMQGDPVRWTVADGDREAELWTADFYKETGAADQRLRIFWSWTAAGEWIAPDNPRFEFRGQPALYKLYIVRDITLSKIPLKDDPAGELLRQLLPRMHKILFSPPSGELQAIVEQQDDISQERGLAICPPGNGANPQSAERSGGVQWSRKSPAYFLN